MKYAIISDIHGNLPALQAVLEDAKQLNVESFIFVGDYVSELPFPNEVVSTVRELKNVHVVRGNREVYLRNLLHQDQTSWIYEQVGVIYWNFRELTRDNLEYLINLPDVNSIDVQGQQKIMAAHSSSQLFGATKLEILSSSNFCDKFEANEFSHDEYLAYIGELLSDDSDLMEKLSTISEDLLVVGHSHVQWHVRMCGKTIVNPGSCGLPLDFNRDASYMIARYLDGQWEIQERRIPYDVEDAIRSTKNSGLYKYAKIWSDIAFEQMRTGKDEIELFLKYVHDIAIEKNFHGSPYPNDIWNLAAKSWFEKVKSLPTQS